MFSRRRARRSCRRSLVGARAAITMPGITSARSTVAVTVEILGCLSVRDHGRLSTLLRLFPKRQRMERRRRAGVTWKCRHRSVAAVLPSGWDTAAAVVTAAGLTDGNDEKT